MHAPIYFAVAVLIAVLLIHYWYCHRIESLESVVQSRDAENQTLRAQLTYKDDQIKESTERLRDAPTLEEALIRLEKLNVDIAAANQPGILLYVNGWGTSLQPTPFLTLKVNVTIINAGTQTALHRWSARVDLSDGQSVTIMGFERSPSSENGQTNLYVDDEVITQNGKRSGWLRFSVSTSGGDLMTGPDVRAVTIRCYDAKGNPYEKTSYYSPIQRLRASSR